MNISRTIRIRKAIIPAAGHGTRLKPLTSIIPKEMLPLGRKPAVEYIVEELCDIGINHIIFVVAPSKGKLQEYFGESVCGGAVRLTYVVQAEQRGLADAILQAEDEVGEEDFIVALGDSVIVSRYRESPILRLIRAYESNPAFSSIVVESVPITESSRYGMVKPVGGTSDGAFEIADLIEKPNPDECPSEYAIAGRYVFSPCIFDWIRHTLPGAGGELQITDSIRLALENNERVWCVPLRESERRYDIGNFSTFCEAFTAMCLADDELAPWVIRAVESFEQPRWG